MQPPDEGFMRQALAEATAAIPQGEVPVGCVVVHGGEVIARAHNLRETLTDPTAHAEIIALRAAAERIGSWHLEEATVYCTVEPCCMCAGALVNARVGRLVYGIADPKSGGCESVFNIPGEPRLNHRVAVTAGVLADEALALLRRFFSERR
jgi:tRNA(adenine34) deaminase